MKKKKQRYLGRPSEKLDPLNLLLIPLGICGVLAVAGIPYMLLHPDNDDKVVLKPVFTEAVHLKGLVIDDNTDPKWRSAIGLIPLNLPKIK